MTRHAHGRSTYAGIQDRKHIVDETAKKSDGGVGQVANQSRASHSQKCEDLASCACADVQGENAEEGGGGGPHRR